MTETRDGTGSESGSDDDATLDVPVFDIAHDSPPITLEMVKDALDEE